MKVDMHILENYGIKCLSNNWIDVMQGVWCIDENVEKGLKETTVRVYDITPITYNELMATIPNELKKSLGMKANQKGTIDMTTVANCAPYAIADSYWTKWHWKDWVAKMMDKEEVTHQFYDKWMPFIIVTYAMERRGVNVDFDRLKAMEKIATSVMKKLHYEMVEIAGVHFEPSSNQQVAELLFGFKKMGKKKVKKGETSNELVFTGNRAIVDASFNFIPDKESISKKTGQPSVGADFLKRMTRAQYPTRRQEEDGKLLIRKLLQYSKISKIYSTYVIGLQEQAYPDGKLHTSLNVGGTTSGRLSSSEPNLQNLVRPVEIADMSALDYLKGEKSFERLVPILRTYRVVYDSVNIPIKLVPKKLGMKGFKRLQSQLDYKAYNRALTQWRKAKWFDIILKELEIRDAFIPDDPENEVITAHD